MWAQARQGIGAVWAQPLLRRITVANTLTNAAVMAGNTLLPVITSTQGGLQPAGFAAIAIFGAVTRIGGAICAPVITERLGLRPTRLITGTGTVAGVLPGPAQW